MSAYAYYWLTSDGGDPGFVVFVAAATSAVFVLTATALAPTHKRLVGVACVVASVLASAFVVTFGHLYGLPIVTRQWALVVVSLLGASLGLFAALSTTNRPVIVTEQDGGSQACAPISTKPPRLRTTLLWATVIIVPVWAFIIALRISATWHTPLVFEPPTGWTSYPSIPFVTPQTQRGRWFRDTGTIWVFSWPLGQNPEAAALSPKSFDMSRNAAYTQYRLRYARIIKICGGHPALMRSFKAFWYGGDDVMTDVYTVWGDTIYWAQYVRPSLALVDSAAMRALPTLCGGMPPAPAPLPNPLTKHGAV